MFNNISNYLENLVAKFEWTNLYGIGRSFIALSLFLTLLFNNIISLIMPLGELSEIHNVSILAKTSIFYILQNDLSAAKVICLIILFIGIIGWKPRYFGVLHWWVAFSFTISSFTLEGGDQVGEIILLLLIPVTLFDKRNWHWKNGIKLSRNIINDSLVILYYSILVIISIQVAFIYFNAAVGKFPSEEWINGTAIYYWFDNSIFGISASMKYFIYPLFSIPFIVTSITWGTMFVELIIFMGISLRNQRIRNYVLILALSLHLLIAVFFGLWSFFFSMCGALFIYLGPSKGLVVNFVKLK